MKKKKTSPKTVTILLIKIVRSNSESLTIDLSKKSNTSSLIPMPAGAPGVANPANQAIINADPIINDCVAETLSNPEVILRSATKIPPEVKRNNICNMNANIVCCPMK